MARKTGLLNKYQKSAYRKGDFCGVPDIALREDFETEIPDGGMNRFALMCDACDS